MSINKVMWAALKAATSLRPDAKKTCKTERQFQILISRLRERPRGYKVWGRKVFYDGRAIPVRLFAPSRKRALPLLLSFHGNGWVTGGIENYTGAYTDLAKAINCTIISVDYQSTSEYKFPVAVEGCYAVTRESFLGRILRMNPDSITPIGDSAGGNLAATVSLIAQGRGESLPKRRILLYPSTYNDHSERSSSPSIRENGTDCLLTSKRTQGFIELYRSLDNDLNSPYSAPPLASDFPRQPRTLSITTEYCPLKDGGETHGEKLRAVRSDVQITRTPDVFCAYTMLPLQFEQVQQTYRIISGFLQKGNLHGKT